jgi:hypothetical protein
MWRCPGCAALFYFKDPDAPENKCDFCKGTFKREPKEEDVMARCTKGEATIIADSPQRKITIKITLDPKHKALENSGVLPTVTNELHDLLRRHFNAHELKVEYHNIVVKTAAKKPAAKK